MSTLNTLEIVQDSKLYNSLLRSISKKISFTDGGCVEWTGAKNDSGYGVLFRKNSEGISKQVFAHRVAYTIFKGPIPDGQIVMHRCDNPLCINPSHLDVGTDADNHLDKCMKGRQPKGITHGSHKITAKDVIKIRASLATQQELADEYGLHQSQISAIQNYRFWKHVRSEVM